MWDQWFPEARAAHRGSPAPDPLYPTATGWHQGEKERFGDPQYDARQTIQRSHAVANGVFVAAPNRIGTEGTADFWGGSFVAAPFGPLFAKASHDREEPLVVDCDRRRVEETRQHWPFLRDRRIDFTAAS